MKCCRIIILSIAIVFVLFSFFVLLNVIPNSSNSQENTVSETGKPVSLTVTKPENILFADDEVFQINNGNGSKPVSIANTKLEDIPYADDEVFQMIRDNYGKIDFLGEFEKGNEEVYDSYKKQYHKLLKCEAPFFDKLTQKEYYINEFREMNYSFPPELIYGGGYSDTYDPHNYLYYFFDMDSDGMPELCVTNGIRFVYILKYLPASDSFILWYEIPPSWTRLLGSRKLSFGGGTSPIQHAFCSLDQNGEEEYFLWFYIEGYHNTKKNQDDVLYMLTLAEFADESKNTEISGNMKNQSVVGTTLHGQYYFRLTKKQWDELTNDYYEACDSTEEKIKEVSFTYDELFGSI